MKRIELRRVSSSNDCTQGILIKYDDGKALCATIERPWKENKNFISCIPRGVYRVEPYSSDKYKGVFQIMDVSGRYNVLVHIGNTVKNTTGCVLVGSEFGYLGGNDAVLNSARAMERLKKYVENQPWWLSVT